MEGFFPELCWISDFVPSIENCEIQGFDIIFCAIFQNLVEFQGKFSDFSEFCLFSF